MLNLDFDVLKATADYLNLGEEKELIEDMETVYTTREYFVAFVGQFSAGKSYLINNIIGREILPQGTMETTPLLTYVRYGAQEKAVVFFMDGKSTEIAVEEVADIIQKGKDNDWNIEQLEHIEIFVDNDLLKSGLILLDTPGINTLIEKHEQLLRQTLLLASRIVYVVGHAPSMVDVEKMADMQKLGFDLAFVRTHCDTINTHEESWNDLVSNDVTVLHETGIAVSSVFHVSNLKNGLGFENIASLRTALQELGANIEDNRLQDFAQQLEVFKEKYRIRLNEYTDNLELKQANNLQRITAEQNKAEAGIKNLEAQCASERSVILSQIEGDMRKLKNSYNERIEDFLESAKAEIINSQVIDDNSMKKLYAKLQRRVSKQALDYLNNNISETLRAINGDVAFNLSSEEFLEIPEICDAEELIDDNNDELQELKNKLHNIVAIKGKIEADMVDMSNSEEFAGLVQSLQEAQEELKKLKEQDNELGTYIPEMLLVQPDGVQPSDVGKTLGNIADWALMFISPTSATTKGGKVAKYLAKTIGTVEKATKIISKGKSVVEIGKNLRNMGKVYATAKRLEKAGKLIKAGKKAFTTLKKKDTAGILDYLNLEHWGQKIGSCFDDPPRYEENLEYRNAYMQEKNRITNELLAIQKSIYDKNCKLELYKDKIEKDKAYLESLQVDEQAISKKLVQREKSIHEAARKDALNAWRQNSAELFVKNMGNTLPAIVEEYLDNMPELLEAYVEKKLKVKMQLITKQQEELEKIMQFNPTQVEEELRYGKELLAKLG